MRAFVWMVVTTIVLCLVLPAAAGKGYMGGAGSVTVIEEPVVPVAEEAPPDTGGLPDTVEGPLNDKMSDAGKLFGDLYKILRQQGTAGDKKLVAEVNAAGDAVLTYDTNYGGLVQLFVTAVNDTTTPDAIVGGEPVLTVIDPGNMNAFADYGWYAAEIGVNPDETPIYGAAQSPYPAMCVQPVANFARWGDISSVTGLTKNRLPLVITYDATWNRSECAVGKLVGDVIANQDGTLNMVTDPWFIPPCTDPICTDPLATGYDPTAAACAPCQWTDPANGLVTYPNGVLWTDLVEEVGFGRLNISRSPEAVLQSSFDEAINNLNSPDTIAIELDAAGRILLTKNVYDPIYVNPDTGLPLLIGTTKKAIDSPLENVAIYVKLMKDGHLVTPGDERAPLDRSKNGGIPLWKMLELTDGPGAKALRPTIDIAKLQAWGMGNLVDVTPVDYLTYYDCVDSGGLKTACLCLDLAPVQPEATYAWVSCTEVADRALSFVTGTDLDPEVDCPVSPYIKTYDPDGDGPLPVDVVNEYVCEGPFTGLTTDDGGAPDGEDLDFAAGALSAAADKTGHISVDMIVYLNSILGINQVLGYSEYDADTGEPTVDAIDYEKNPVYFNFRQAYAYGDTGRAAVFGNRGTVVTPGGGGAASTYNGKVTVLQVTSPTWTETAVSIMAAETDGDLDLTNGVSIFDDIGLGVSGFPDGTTVAEENILGFTQMADDNLSVIRFIHTFQIPSLR